jgi:predicted metal-binding membrane protein
LQHRLVAARARPSPIVYLVAGAWLTLLVLGMSGYGAVIRHDRLLVGGPPLWLATIAFVAGWQVMVLAMMAPASLHGFHRVAMGRELVGFTSAYLAVWTAFGLAIFFFDAGLHLTVNHWAWLSERTSLIPGTTLVLCGTYQLSDLKSRALERCREANGGGFHHALDCVAASGGLMLLAFALAAGSLVAMAAVTMVMVWEASSFGRTVVKPLGYGLIALGVLVLYGPIQTPF